MAPCEVFKMSNHAIVIGIDAYKNPAWNLDAAVNDRCASLIGRSAPARCRAATSGCC